MKLCEAQLHYYARTCQRTSKTILMLSFNSPVDKIRESSWEQYQRIGAEDFTS